MIVEYVQYTIAPEPHGAFEAAYGAAQSALRASPHCLRYEVTRCVEDPTAYVVRIEWDSQEGHLQGFRSSPEFRTFFAAVRPFVGNIEEMRHYEVVDIASDNQGGG